jgi:hypothetical protein
VLCALIAANGPADGGSGPLYALPAVAADHAGGALLVVLVILNPVRV